MKVNNIVYIVIIVIFSLVFLFVGWQLHQLIPKSTVKSTTDELQTYVSGLGFSFDYPKDMTVIDGSDDTDGIFRILIVPNSYKAGSQSMTAVVISASPNNPPMTPLQWLKSPDSGADMSKGYSTLNMDGQEAVSMENGTWVVVDTPGNAWQISIATLPGENPSQSLRDEMTGIVKSFTFR